MLDEGLDQVVLNMLKLESRTSNLDQWKEFLRKHKNPKEQITIGLIGKYVELQDSYKSILESLIHSGAANEVKVMVESIHSEFLNADNVAEKLKNLDGVIVAPGFGGRGTEGKIDAVRYVRENNIPFLGICLGMQMAVIEYARNVMGLQDANSIEMDEHCKEPVISIMENQKTITDMGGTMRLGAWDCDLLEGSLAHKAYGKNTISERHRHRYEFNDQYRKEVEASGLKATGINPKTGLVEVVENPSHPWFVGVQYHPEYKSTVLNPHPLFVDFIQASLQYNHSK